ncbi:hypothetical protein C8R47DRAFT_1037328 [Mycena vitilis]|nr:hypothetical protein C8R47DRAFT_1037328 [Mycena vitilis]
MAALEPKNSPSTLASEHGKQSKLESSPGSHPQNLAAGPKKTYLAFLPLWVSGPLRSPKAWKVMLRCWIAVFASFVLILPDASLRTVGTTSFFAILTSLFLPPYLPVQLTIFLLSTLMLGLLSGWGIGVGAMRAANAVRDQAHIQAVVGQIQASIKANPVFQANPALAQSTAIFDGLFLDLRASAVYGGFLIIGSFIFGLIRAYAPKLLFMSIFGTIAVDIFCAVGPLFPTARYTLLNSTAISIACYIAIALLTTVFVFPETMCHAAMDTLVLQLARVQQLVEMQDEVLAGNATTSPALVERFKALRAHVIGAQRQLGATSGMLALEFTWGRWNGNDVQALEEPTVTLIIRVGTLVNFDRLAGTTAQADMPPTSSSSSASSSSVPRGDSRWHETQLLRSFHTQHAALEAAHNVRPADVLPVLDASTRNLRRATVDALSAIGADIARVNRTRWRRRTDSSESELDRAAAVLGTAIEEFKTVRRMELLQPFAALLDAHGAAATESQTDQESERELLPLRSLFIAYVFVSNLLSIAEAVQVLLGAVQDINAKRTRGARLWAPTGLRNAWRLLTAKGDSGDGAAAFGEDTSAGVGTIGEEENLEYRKDPDSRPPTNTLQRLMNGIHRGYLWTKTAEAVFTLKYVFTSVALWLPSVFRSSAHFYYVEKGIWALIMAQTTLNIYAADQIFNYVTRLGGTLLGLALGLVGWYAGNGNGNGNPYGAAAAFGVVVLPLIFLRVFAPEPYLAGNVMCCATFALVMGYSWIDGHAVQFASPGIGWSVAWRRWALVVAGSAASFIVMMFPPKSGRKAVRTRNAGSIASLSNAYGFLISAWIAAQREGPTPLSSTLTQPGGWAATFRAQLLALGEELQTIRALTGLAKWEGSIRGRWPAEVYMRFVDVQSEMVAILAQLATSLGHLEKECKAPYLQGSRVLNPHFISEVISVFSLISQSLRTGEPMHQVIPTNLLDRLFYHETHGRAPGTTLPPVDVGAIKSLSYMYYATSIVAVYQMLRSLDELHRITKDLCGEIPLNGFSEWREEYDRTQSAEV